MTQADIWVKFAVAALTRSTLFSEYAIDEAATEADAMMEEFYARFDPLTDLGGPSHLTNIWTPKKRAK